MRQLAKREQPQPSLLDSLVRRVRELGFVSRLAQSMQGSTAYTASLGFRRGVAEL